MSKPKEKEVMFAYIVVASYAVSLLLIRVDNRMQMPVYYVSKSLHEAKVRYLPLEKGYLGNGACYMEAPSLLPGSHSCGFNPTSSSITTPES